ncbi:MAG: DMT family transporter [Alphaproteobacteria bacterium]|nr:DMT family transporter [Alphaproteobacteria bacterium]
MLASTAFVSVNDAIIKWLTAGYPVGQIMFLRGIFSFLPLVILVWRSRGLHELRMHDPRGPLLRGALVVAGTFLFMTSVSLLPLADVVAIVYAGPLFVTALAALLLGERVTRRRWLAVGIGFGGVVLMVHPSGEGFRAAALVPLAAALAGALRDIVTRRISRQESSLAVLAVTTVMVTLAGSLTLPFGWQPVAWFDLGLFALGGCLISGAHFLMIESFRLAEAAVVAPFRYSSLVWAAALGYAVWHYVPGPWVLAGAGIVMASGLYIWHDERRPGA